MPIVARNPPVVPKATEKKRRSGVIVASVVVAILVVAGIATAGYFLLRGTPAAPEVALLGASCIHEFCVTAPGNATVVPLSGTARRFFGHAAMRAVGYRQLWQHLAGGVLLAEAVKRAIAATRQLAKRQLTWIRSDATLERIDPHTPGAFDDWNLELRRELSILGR